MASTPHPNQSNAEINIENCLMIFVVYSPPSSYIWSSAAACLVNIVFAIAGTILNSLVLFAFWKSAKLQSKLHYFAIMLLSSADLGVTTVVHPLFLIKSMNEILGTAKCLHGASYFIALCQLSGASFWMLFIINIERYLSIVHPIWHRAAVNKRRILLVWIFFGFLTTVQANIPVYESSLSLAGTALINVACATYLFTSLSIFRVARKRLRTISPGYQASGQENSDVSFHRQVRMANTLSIIVALYFVCFLPIGVVLVLQNPWDRNKIPSRGVVYALPWVVTLASMNSTLNCLVFFWANREIRKEGIKILKKCFSR